ncbi:hypothetical protein HC766_08490 [Candidatus Gracilibacteria bacterium]|nr:hypothetical protein [Candidatus Gracilibacteria bacterium]
MPSQGYPANYWITFLSLVADLITFLSPAAVLKLSVIRVIGSIVENSYYELGLAESFDKVQWFSLLVGTKLAFATALSLLVCGTGTYWLLQGWQRRFSNPSATVLSKRQSYLFVACCQAIFLGFFLPFNSRNSAEIVLSLLIFNWIFFLVLICSFNTGQTIFVRLGEVSKTNRSEQSEVVAALPATGFNLERKKSGRSCDRP